MEVIHAGLARTAVFFSLLMGIWAFWRFFRRQGVDSSYFGAAVIAEVLYLAQGLVGLILVFTGHYGNLARPSVHILYGAVSVLIIPAVYLYTHGSAQRRVMMIYAVAFLFLTAMLYFRGISTGLEKSPQNESLLPRLEQEADMVLAEREGFEPSSPFGEHALQACALGQTTRPLQKAVDGFSASVQDYTTEFQALVETPALHPAWRFS